MCLRVGLRFGMACSRAKASPLCISFLRNIPGSSCLGPCVSQFQGRQCRILCLSLSLQHLTLPSLLGSRVHRPLQSAHSCFLSVALHGCGYFSETVIVPCRTAHRPDSHSTTPDFPVLDQTFRTPVLNEENSFLLTLC